MRAAELSAIKNPGTLYRITGVQVSYQGPLGIAGQTIVSRCGSFKP